MAGLASCVNKTMRTWQESMQDGRYDSEFPSHNASPEIEGITHSVRKLYNVSHYTTYQFTREARITKFNIRDGSFQEVCIRNDLHAGVGIRDSNHDLFGGKQGCNAYLRPCCDAARHAGQLL